MHSRSARESPEAMRGSVSVMPPRLSSPMPWPSRRNEASSPVAVSHKGHLDVPSRTAPAPPQQSSRGQEEPAAHKIAHDVDGHGQRRAALLAPIAADTIDDRAHRGEAVTAADQPRDGRAVLDAKAR